MSLNIVRMLSRSKPMLLTYTVNGQLHLNVSPSLNTTTQFSYNKLTADAQSPPPINPNDLHDNPLTIATNPSPCFSTTDYFETIDRLYELDGSRAGGMGEFDTPLVFGGAGNPLSSLDLIESIVASVKLSSRHGVSFSVTTDGLVHSTKLVETMAQLLESGIKEIEIGLVSSNPNKYKKIVGSTIDGLKFQDVVAFTSACVENKMEVTCGVWDSEGAKLALALGAIRCKRFGFDKEGSVILLDGGEGGGRGSTC